MPATGMPATGMRAAGMPAAGMTAAGAAPAGALPAGSRRWWTLAAVCVGIFMLLLDLTIVNVALPQIAHDFHASLSDLQWVIDAYALTLAALQLTAGSLGDLFGRRTVFAIGIAVFTLGSLLCGFSTGSPFLIVARVFQGIGGATMFATSLALLSGAFSGRERGVAFGVFGAVSGVAVAVGPVLGGVITSGISWRWIFFVNLPIGVLALLGTVLRVEESRSPHARRPDLPGFVLFSAALGLFVFGVIETTHRSWGAPLVVGCLAGAATLLVGFLAVELRSREPMLDLSLLRVPTFTGGLIAALGLGASIFSLFTYLVLYLQVDLGLSPLQSGLRFLVVSGSIFVSASIAGRLTSSVPAKWLLVPGFALIGTGTLLLGAIHVGGSWTDLIPGFVVGGIGAGCVNVPLSSTAVGVVDPSRSGMASGLSSTMRQVGVATGIAVLGSIFAGTARAAVVEQLSRGPLHAEAAGIAAAVVTGGGGSRLSATAGGSGLGRSGLGGSGLTPRAARLVASATEHGFVAGMDRIFVVAAAVAFVAGACCVPLIRQRDLVTGAPGGGPSGPGPAVG